MLGGEVIEGEQRIAILGQAFDRLVVFRSVAFREGVEGGDGLLLRFGHPDLLQRALGLDLPCRLFGSLLRTFAVLCTQHRCSRVVGHISPSAFQKPSAPAELATRMDPDLT